MAHKATLSWNAPSTGDAPSFYEVKRSNITMGPFNLIAEVPASQLTYVDTDVVAGESWSYIVTSKNPQGESGPSNEVTISVPFLVSGAPSGLAVEVT